MSNTGIGWYVHHHGRGHLQRMRCIAAQLSTPVTVLSSLPKPSDWKQDWIELTEDGPAGGDTDVTAGGTLHWAPRHHPGLLSRTAAIVAWVAQARPALVVADVSVEVAVLVRSLGVPVVVAAMRGDRGDRAHRTAYDLAEALLAPWPGDRAEPWTKQWLDKTWHVGALSRLDHRMPTPPPGDRRVAVLWGGGGSEVGPAEVAAAQAATPNWTWSTAGLPGGPRLTDPWSLLQAADVVVTHGGQNALAEVAAARRPAVVVPQERPHGEQQANGRALRGIALVEPRWPEPQQWPELLDRARRLDPAGWRHWSDGTGAARAAGLLDAAATRLTPLGVPTAHDTSACA